MFLIALFACADEAAIGGPIPTPSTDELVLRETDGLETFEFNDDNALFYVALMAPEDSKGHDHVVRASGISGTASYDSSDPSSLSVEVTLDVGDLLVDEPDMRAHLGLSEDLSEGNRASIQKHMRDASQLDYPTFDTISFVSTAYDGVTLAGDMTIRGVTVPIEAGIATRVAETGLYLEGGANLLGTDYGFEPYGTGAYFNSDEIRLQIDARGE